MKVRPCRPAIHGMSMATLTSLVLLYANFAFADTQPASSNLGTPSGQMPQIDVRARRTLERGVDGSTVVDQVFYGISTYQTHDNGRSVRRDFSVVPNLNSVVIIIDADKVGGFDTGQLSEYIAMVGLSKVNMEASFGDLPTILSLFSSPEITRPQGLSSWDRSFLRAVYQTDQVSRYQRVAVANHMVADLTR